MCTGGATRIIAWPPGNRGLPSAPHRTQKAMVESKAKTTEDFNLGGESHKTIKIINQNMNEDPQTKHVDYLAT